MVVPDRRVEEWPLTERTTRLLTIASLAITILGVGLFASIYATAHGGLGSFAFGGWKVLGAVLLTTLLTLPLYVVHEAIHGQAMRRFGVRARYGWGEFGGLPGYLYCTAA